MESPYNCNPIEESTETVLFRDNMIPAEMISAFFISLSEYIEFLRGRSRYYTEDSFPDWGDNKNLFIPGPHVPAETLGDAMPVFRFKEAVEVLKDAVKEHSTWSFIVDGFDRNLQRLRILAAMADEYYKSTQALEILDQKIMHLQAILLLLPPSHPERNLPYLQLGRDLVARFEHTDDLYDLDHAISHYSQVCLTGMGPCVRIHGLVSCLMMRSIIVHGTNDCDKATEILLEVLPEVPTSSPCHHLALFSLELLAMQRYAQSTNSSDFTQVLQDTISYCRDTLSSYPETPNASTEIVSLIITSFSLALVERYEKTSIKVDAHDVVNLVQKFLFLYPSTSPDKRNRLSCLFTRLLSASSHEGYSDDMVPIIRRFFCLMSESDEKCFPASALFFSVLVEQYSRTGNMEDLDEAIAVYRDIVLLPPPEILETPRYKEMRLDSFFNLLVQRYRLSGINEDSTEITAIYRDMLAFSTTAGDKQKAMGSYAEFLILRFEKFSQLEDIEEAISLYRDGLAIVSQSEDYSANMVGPLINLAQALLSWSKVVGEIGNHLTEVLNEAISCLMTAMALSIDHTKYTEAKRVLHACLIARYYETRDPKDLYRAADLYRGKEEQLPLNHSSALQDIERIQNPLKLEDTIGIYRQLLSLQPFPHSKRSETLLCLGKALSLMFDIYGGRILLDEAVLLLREAVSISPKSIEAAKTLLAVFLQIADMGELDMHESIYECKAITLHCLSLIPANSRGSLGKLLEWAKRKLGEDDIFSSQYSVDVTSMIKEMISGKIISPFEAARRISTTLWLNFRKYGDVKDLEESIYHEREAVRIFPDNYPQRPAVLHDVGRKLFAIYEILQKPEDLDEALHYYFQSIQTSQPGNYFKSTYLINLGVALTLKLKLKPGGETNDLNHAFIMLNGLSMVFRAGALEATSSPVPERFRAARMWALLGDIFDHESALEAYEHAISFLPRLSSMGANVMTRQEAFKAHKIDGLSRNAALYAIRKGRYDKAIEFMEAGRAVFWLQALQLRTPMDRLREAAPELEAKLMGISYELDRASMNSHAQETVEIKVRDEELFVLEQLNDEWSQTVDIVRGLEGFQDFLLPKKLSSLQAFINRPVIFLIPDEKESHALVIMADVVKHVELPNAPYEKLQDLVARLPGSGRKGGGRIRGVASELCAEVGDVDESVNDIADVENHGRAGRPSHLTHIDSEEQIRHVLQTLWNDVVCPIVCALGLGIGCEPLKVCWCPTGIFSFLPLHAAGIYDVDMSSVEIASDFFISSYTPTVGALTNDKPRIDVRKEFKMMVVIDSRSLPNTFQEMKVIKRHVFPGSLVKFGTRDSPALVESIASNLSTVSIAHFACHGKQLPDRPLDSSLMLEDGDLKISRIMEERMPDAALAFLCACETAMGDKDLPDEAMHLGATLLFSGFRGVVATMWSIDDADGPVVADAFYVHLFKEDPRNPDTALAAEAVHNATAELRKQRVGFRRWVPFIHLGS